MHWTLTFDIPEGKPKIDHRSSVLSIGSCFSTVIGDKLSDRKFPVLNNPFGVLFNPISMAQALEDALLGMPINTDMILIRDGMYLHFGMHSDVVAYSGESLKRLIQKKQEQTKLILTNASHIIITLGTAWVYEYGQYGQIVANCHKQPSALFEKRLLTPKEISKTYSGFFNVLRQINPKLEVIFTVSPVRHTKDGIPENQLSKAILRMAIQEIVDQFDFSHYFPSYEIMMDELRDYRFYKEDMIHPSLLAEDYIWERFKNTWIDSKTYPLIQEFEGINRDLSHKAFNPDSAAHLKFLDNLQRKIDRYSKDFDFSKEMDQLRKQQQKRGR
jgi:hypothetical protein